MLVLRVILILCLLSPMTACESMAASRKSSAVQKLSTPVVEVGVVQTTSLYDRRTARKVGSSSKSSSWFGPKSSGIRYDARMIEAAKIAEARAKKKSIKRCWRHVKVALVEAKVVNSYPQTGLAKQAANELTSLHGFKRLPITDPFKAPVGSVLVYGGPGAGHVEIRTYTGFVSDFESPTPSKRPLIGVFVKPS